MARNEFALFKVFSKDFFAIWTFMSDKAIFIQLVVINWLLGFVYDHFLNKNVYACGYKIFPLVLEVTKICHSFASLTLDIFL